MFSSGGGGHVEKVTPTSKVTPPTGCGAGLSGPQPVALATTPPHPRCQSLLRAWRSGDSERGRDKDAGPRRQIT